MEHSRIPKYVPRKNPDGTFTMEEVSPRRIEINLESTSLTVIQIMQYINIMNKKHPTRRYWLDGDRKAVMSEAIL